MRTQPQRQNDLDLVSYWALIIVTATALLTGGYAIIHAAGQTDEARTQLSRTLPANYRDTLKAMLLSAGVSCNKVCGMTASVVTPEGARFRVSCGLVATAEDPCATTEDYLLTLEPLPVPSR